MTRKGSVMSKVVSQQYEPNQNNEEKVKHKERMGDASGNHNREVEHKNMG